MRIGGNRNWVTGVGVTVVASSLMTGCNSTTEPTPSAAPTSATKPMPKNLTRQDAIAWARGIDPCALIDRDKLAALGTIRAFGTASSPTSCAAHMDDGSDRGVDVDWAIAFTPTDFLTTPLGTLTEIDGARIRQIDSASALPPATRGQLVESRCNFDVPFENDIAVRMSVSMARDRKACTSGEALVRAVLSKWPSQPAQGSSPNTTVTALTRTAPCAVVPELQKVPGLVFDWKDQTLDSCFFKRGGMDLLVSFNYRTRELATVNAQPTVFGGHPGYTATDRGTTTATAIVGDEFSGVGAGRERRLVPVVEVSGDNPAAVSDVMAAVLAQLPT